MLIINIDHFISIIIGVHREIIQLFMDTTQFINIKKTD